MKRIVLKSLATLLLFSAQNLFSQVTLLSNNTNLDIGIPLNGKALLLADHGDNDSLWVTDGTPAGTVKLTSSVSFIDASGAVFYNNKLFFAGANAANGGELWVTDATVGGTTLVKDINPTGNSVPTDFMVFNNTLFFIADDGSQGAELWKSDGTTAGTVFVKNINPGAASGFPSTNSADFTIANGILFFTATTATDGFELWKTDGTTAGTVLVKDITAGTPGTTFGDFTFLGTNLIFSVTTPGATSAFQLWKSDGTGGGTSLIKDFGLLSGIGVFNSFYTFNNKVFFTAGDPLTTGAELWVTDGSIAGTTLVKDINPGTPSSTAFLFLAVTINNKFYFQASTALEGAELWVSDGTPAGTQLLKDINTTGTNGSSPFLFKDFSSIGLSDPLYNGKIFFMANDGSRGNELWATDGTAAGTAIVKDIRVGTPSGLSSGTLSYFYTTSGLYFSANDGSGAEPWLSNGTDAGTARVFDVNTTTGTAGSNPQYLFVYNNQLYFNGTNGDDAINTDLFKINATTSILPITLLNFSAIVEANSSVKLNWTTTNEINSSHFEVERSTDGNKFTKISLVAAAGNSTMNLNYSYLDQQAGSLNSPLIYYRLKLVDKDGGFKSSSTLLVHLKENSLQFSFTPNPAQQQLNVVVSPGGAKNAALRIVDINGKIVYEQSLSSGVNVYQQNINVARLQKGLYYIQLITDKTTTTQKFVKQ